MRFQNDQAETELAGAGKMPNGMLRNTHLSVFGRLGSAYIDERAFSKLEKLTMQFSSIYPDEAIGYHYLGIALFEQQKLDDALTNFEKALSLNRNVGSQYRIGRIYQERGDKEKAAKFYEEFLTLKNISEKSKDDAKRRLDKLKRN